MICIRLEGTIFFAWTPVGVSELFYKPIFFLLLCHRLLILLFAFLLIRTLKWGSNYFLINVNSTEITIIIKSLAAFYQILHLPRRTSFALSHTHTHTSLWQISASFIDKSLFFRNCCKQTKAGRIEKGVKINCGRIRIYFWRLMLLLASSFSHNKTHTTKLMIKINPFSTVFIAGHWPPFSYVREWERVYAINLKGNIKKWKKCVSLVFLLMFRDHAKTEKRRKFPQKEWFSREKRESSVAWLIQCSPSLFCTKHTQK
jgi:hypothetical protein